MPKTPTKRGADKRTSVKSLQKSKKDVTQKDLKKIKGGLEISPWIGRNKKGDGS